jgi:sugar phosphate isomerase/epimerase
MADVVRVLPAGTMDGVAIEAHLDAAAATGFDAVSLRPRHLRSWLAEAPGRRLDRLASLLRQLALGLVELDPVTGWSDPRTWAAGELPGRVVEELDMASVLGATAVTALVLPEEGWDGSAAAEGLSTLCAAAAERGVRVQIEPFGWSPLWSAVEAAALVTRVGAVNAGVLVDTWHHQRRGGDAASLDVIPVDLILGVQASDGPAAPDDLDLRRDCFAARTWPGDPAGQQHPERVLGALLRRGWSGPVGVEVFGPVDDPLQRAARTADALDAMLGATEGWADG